MLPASLESLHLFKTFPGLVLSTTDSSMSLMLNFVENCSIKILTVLQSSGEIILDRQGRGRKSLCLLNAKGSGARIGACIETRS